MRLTPLDLLRAQFGAAVRGFNRTEVSSFLTEADDDLELALRNAERARQEVSALHAKLAEDHQREAPSRDTVLAAQRVPSEIREAAKREAELIVREARGQANEVERELTDLRHQRRDAEKSLENSIATLLTAFDVVKRQDRGVNSVDNVREHHPRPTMAATGSSA